MRNWSTIALRWVKHFHRAFLKQTPSAKNLKLVIEKPREASIPASPEVDFNCALRVLLSQPLTHTIMKFVVSHVWLSRFLPPATSNSRSIPLSLHPCFLIIFCKNYMRRSSPGVYITAPTFARFIPPGSGLLHCVRNTRAAAITSTVESGCCLRLCTWKKIAQNTFFCSVSLHKTSETNLNPFKALKIKQ